MAAATLSMARSTAGDAIWAGVLAAATLRTYWRAADCTSSAVAGGSRPLSGVMFRHMVPACYAQTASVDTPDADETLAAVVCRPH